MLTIGTIGPKIKTQEEIKKLIQEGANGIRINFSHCDYTNLPEIIKYIKINFPKVLVIGDIQGHKVRVGKSFKFPIKVTKDRIAYFCSESKYEQISKLWKDRSDLLIPISVEEEDLLSCSSKKIFMKDGSMEFEVIKKQGAILQCKAIYGGIVRAEKGCNIPGLDRKCRTLTTKDIEDIKVCLQNKVDTILYSYVYDEMDIANFRAAINQLNRENSYTPKLWAKIETEKAINNIKAIASKMDGLVLGRGDLLPETNIYKLALYQHNFIRALKNSDKEVVIATHVLDSLKENDKPTINEMNDIFYCIGGGVSGFMLTGETSVGKDPVNAIRVLKKAVDFYSKVLKKN